jgi:hypothetical protein
MSIPRLLATATVMGAIAVVLATLTAPVPAMTSSLAAAQRTADTQGPDVLIVSAAGLLAWAVWAWGVLGLALTAASALPGLAGSAARLLVHVALPGGARRAAALLLGLGLGVAAPLAGALVPGLAPPASAATSADQTVPDWPLPPPPARSAPVPDWPTGPESSAPERVVVRGDCLWHIAADALLGDLGRLPTDGEVATAVPAWWSANVDVIGPDPDLLVPGQVLRPPGPP